MKALCGLVIFLVFHSATIAQEQPVRDSLVKDSPVVDSLTVALIRNNADSVVTKSPTVVKPAVLRFDSLAFSNTTFYNIKDPIPLIAVPRVQESKDSFFYILVGLLLFFALVRNNFHKYIQDLMRLFFRTTIKQRQVKEQMMQNPFPSLLLNLLYLFSGSFFANLVLQHYKLGQQYNFWWLLLYGMVALALIYFIKFLTLKLCGWLFRAADATDAYIFIVFSTNKVIGIALLPVVILLAFAKGYFYQVVLNLSFLMLAMLFLYRFYLSYVSLQRQLKIRVFHFALYLCAFELIPLLLINKLLFQFLSIKA